VRTLPHDNQAFTQGLLYHNNELFESTGLYGNSSLRRIDVNDGSIKTNIPIPDIFTEGLVLKDNIFVQLTWRSGYAFQYSYPSLRSIGHFKYTGEGWGITCDDSYYIMSNGSDTLYFRDDKFTVKKKLAVILNGKRLRMLNELEYAREKIYANVLYNNFIYEIDPKSGTVMRMINCTSLVQKAKPAREQDVLNGVAYDAQKDVFYITGKNWPVVFEVKIPL
jgi:glutamine cyclotransferase